MGPLAGIRVVELAGIGPGEHTDEVLGESGFSAAEISRLRAARAIA